ncbi:MAG: glycosyltransferase [Candidatus Woesearchaeota archaeon]
MAELLMSLNPLFNRIGIHSRWSVMSSKSKDFFKITKDFFNALQGQEVHINKKMKNTYIRTNKLNAHRLPDIGEEDLVIVHDHQPAAMINYYNKKQPWIWRAHADMHTPYGPAWNFLKKYINRYDKMIVSMDKYKKSGVKPEQHVFHPAIDPTNEKNIGLSDKQVTRMLSRYGIDRDKPIISQISRFDRFKDPVGVIKSYKMVKEKTDCQLILLGEPAADDPEGPDVHREVLEYSSKDPDIHVIMKRSEFLVNALQRASSVVLQKSLKEGFALTVAEALWKGTPVVGGDHGGIPLQITNGRNGYLVNSIHETAKRVTHLLENPKLAKRMGKRGREHIRKNFLTTRLALDYLHLFKQLKREGKLNYLS